MIDIAFTWRWRWWARPLLAVWIVLARVGLARVPTRRDISRLIIVSVAAIALLGCPRSPAPPVPDSGDAALIGDARPDAGACGAACGNLARLGCKEGLDPKCLVVCEHDVAQPLTVLPLSCWASASTKEIARSCGDARVGHLECP